MRERKCAIKIHRRRDCGGVTLVELLVSAVIMAVFLAGAVAMMRYMRSEQNNDYHRRQARTVIARIFETTLNNGAFNGMGSYILKEDFVTAKKDTIKVTSTTESAANGEEIGSIYLDRRGDSPAIPAKVTVKAWKDTINITSDGGGTKSGVVTHTFKITVKWTEIGGTADSLAMTKRLVESI